MWSRRRSRAWVTLGLAALGAVVFWNWVEPVPLRSAPAKPPQPGTSAVPVAIATVSRADVPVMLRAIASVAALNTVTVRSRVDGELKRVAYREGQFIKRGDLLVEIDPRPFQVQLEQAEGQLARDQAQLATARVDLKRYETLLAQDSIASQNVDEQRSTVKQLEAALKVDQSAIDSARLNLTYSRITAPISGIVGLRLVDAGNFISASSGQGLVVITQVQPIAVLFTVPQDALNIVLPRIRAGAKLPVDAFDRGGATRLASGMVLTIDNQIDPTTGTVRIKAVFDNADRALFPQQFVNVQLLVDTERSQLVVPVAAVQQGPQGPFVYVVRDGKAMVRPVAVGITQGDRTSVRSGLSAGDVVITNGIDALRDGSSVEVRR